MSSESESAVSGLSPAEVTEEDLEAAGVQRSTSPHRLQHTFDNRNICQGRPLHCPLYTYCCIPHACSSLRAHRHSNQIIFCPLSFNAVGVGFGIEFDCSTVISVLFVCVVFLDDDLVKYHIKRHSQMQFCVKKKLLNGSVFFVCFKEHNSFDKLNAPLVNKSDSKHFYTVTKKKQKVIVFISTIIMRNVS